MSSTQAECCIHLAILDRAKKVGLTMPTWRTLLALGKKSGHSTTGDLSKTTGSTFNWTVIQPIHDMGMIKRKKQGLGQFDHYHYNITAYGERVLDYISSGRGEV